MDLDDVRVFTKVVELGSFTKAATWLKMPKSTVSRRVNQLEEDLNTRLLQRTTRKLSLTYAGEIYFRRAARLIEELQQAEIAVQELQDEPRGLLRITTPSDLGGMLSQLTVAFQESYPLVELSILSTSRKVDLVAEGLDLALRAGKLDDSTLVSRKLFDTHFGLFASDEYLKLNAPPCSPEALATHRCLTFGTKAPRSTWLLQGPEGDKHVEVQGKICSDDFLLLRSLARLGQGIALLPFVAGAGENPNWGLKRVLPEYHCLAGGAYLVYPSSKHLSPKVRAFIDFSLDWIHKTGLLNQP